jgi:hypothetical protein
VISFGYARGVCGSEELERQREALATQVPNANIYFDCIDLTPEDTPGLAALFGLTLTYRTWDGFAAGEPPSQTPVPILNTWTSHTDAMEVSPPIIKPPPIPRHAILRLTLAPRQPTLAQPQGGSLPTRVTVQIGAIRADVAR